MEMKQVFHMGKISEYLKDHVNMAEDIDHGNANLSIGFVAEDLDALHDALAADGFRPTDYVSPMPQVRFFFVEDPAGVNVQFM